MNVEEGNFEKVKRIWDSSYGDIDLECKNENGFTSLALAIRHRQMEIAKFFIMHRANVNSLNKVRNILI